MTRSIRNRHFTHRGTVHERFTLDAGAIDAQRRQQAELASNALLDAQLRYARKNDAAMVDAIMAARMAGEGVGR